MKIWGKTVKKEKITRDIIFETDNFYDNFDSNLAELCHCIDIPNAHCDTYAQGILYTV